MDESLEDAVLALGRASLSGAKILTAGYRAGNHLETLAWSLPGSGDLLEVVIAILLPLSVLFSIRYVPQPLWLLILCMYVTGVVLFLSVNLYAALSD